MGEDEDDDEWELIDARRVDYDTEAQQDAMWTFATVPSGKPQASSEQDNAVIKVRYAYMPKKTGTADHESRDFCQAHGQRRQPRVAKGGHRGRFTACREPRMGAKWCRHLRHLPLQRVEGSCQHYFGSVAPTYVATTKRSSVNRARAIIREAGLPPMQQNDRKASPSVPATWSTVDSFNPRTGKHRNKWHSPLKSFL